MYLKIATYPPRVDTVSLEKIVPAYVEWVITSKKTVGYEQVQSLSKADEIITTHQIRADNATNVLAEEKSLPIDWEHHNV